MRDILCEHLKPENRERALNLYTEDASWMRFWSEECVQLDGDFTFEQLKALVETMESFKEKP